MSTATAEEIRQFVDVAYIQPARRCGKHQVTVVALNVHNDMKLDNRMPAVCGALDAKIMSRKLNLSVVQRAGPKQSSTATWVFGISTK